MNTGAIVYISFEAFILTLEERNYIMKGSHEMVSAVIINSWIGFKNHSGEKWTVYNNKLLPYYAAFLILPNPCCFT